MRIVVLGSRGQLGSKVVEALSAEPGLEVTGTDRGRLDVTDPGALEAGLRDLRPEWVINCTAYTDVEKAETEPEKAYLVNDAAVGFIADAALKCGARVLHVSTDYVFSGEFGGAPPRPYLEEDAPGPLCVYAASKLAGERRLSGHGVHSSVLRTSWLYGGPGKTFLHTMLRVGSEALRAGRPVRVVADQRGTPTDAWSLAAQIRRVVLAGARGLFHAASVGEATWFDFTREIFTHAGLEVRLEPIGTADYPTRARRPPYSVLENRKLDELGLNVMPPWKEGLARAWQRIKKE
ncbi:MAG TPA: dTDP-4-dehydrorhamnose reductase [Planctomycetota bacterium]|nr:dTDP-4-dehydrorhamnose reductase [Planctomycetota bacterium]